MFIGRTDEFCKLKKQLESDKKSAILVYGKRRIGKSRLISEVVQSFDGIAIEHTCAKTTYLGNLQLLSRSICDVMELPPIEFSELIDVFDFLGKQGKDKRIVIVLDEYQYLKQSCEKGKIDSLMQIIIDKLPSNINVILCGSYVTIMKELLEEDNPLFGRFTETIHLQAFDYYDASLFWPDATEKEKIERYAVFGGSPFTLETYDEGMSFGDNIKKYLLTETGILRSYIENVILKEIQKAYDIRIFEIIGNGKKKYSEIVTSLGEADNGLLDKQLKYLISMESIKKVFPINKPNDKKKQFYEICDNLVRFYFTYIFGRGSLINKLGIDQFYELYVESTIDEFISRRFEDVSAQYFMRKVRSGKLKGVFDIGSYWYDNPENRSNGEFDVVLKREKGYDIFECKYYKNPMSMKECDLEAKQIGEIKGLSCNKIGFVCLSGFECDSKVYSLHTGKDLFEKIKRVGEEQ